MSLAKADAQSVQSQLKAQINTFLRKVTLQSSKLSDIANSAKIIQGSTDDTINAMQSEDDIQAAIDSFTETMKVFSDLTHELNAVAKSNSILSNDIEGIINTE